ncbi:MAG TPA: selenide, water dikinase SelD [Actinomycetota bacterium]|nr:selenide, water dikinase SelD [Actinomycetota bacterium]
METETVRLTSFSHGAGCACKLAPADLADVMGRLTHPARPPEVLVDADTGDDAAVYALPDGRALIQTVDFFTPVVDDAYDWGRVAAANALSDVYAMGGAPVLALNLVAWPVQDLPLELLARVLEGGQAVAAEAGVAIVGGHSIHDPEPKYGMAVTGFADRDGVVRNSTAPPGATLFLTKPLGVGIVTTAIKRGAATPAQARAAVETMAELNRDAAQAMLGGGVAAATDVTGFGLLGHLHGMLRASGIAAEVDAGALRFLDGTADLVLRGVVPGGTKANHRFLNGKVNWGDLVLPEQLMLADAQTSGGLLIAAPDAARMRAALGERGIAAMEIGVTNEGEPGTIRVRGHPR